RKKAGIITGSVLGSILVLAVIAFFLLNYFNFPIMNLFGFGDNLWQYDKKIQKPISALSDKEDITLGELNTDGVSVYIPSETFDGQTNVTLSHPDKKPEIDISSFEPLSAPISIDSANKQKRLNKPIKITLSIDNLERDKSGALYIAALNEKNGWDYIQPDEIDLQKNVITFTTCRLGTYGFVNLKRDRFINEFSRNNAMRQWSVRTLEPEAISSREGIVKDILQNKLAILDEDILGKLQDAVAIDCPSNRLAIALIDKDSQKYTQMIADSVGRNIPKLVDSMILKESLEGISAQPWVENISEELSEKMDEGNLTKATILVVQDIAEEFIEDNVKNVWVDLADRKIRIWDNIEVEEAYQVYKNGTKDAQSLWGYQVAAKDFESLWGQMRGITEQIIEKDLNSYCRTNNKKINELTDDEIKKISEDVKQRTKSQFEERLQQDSEIDKIKNDNGKMIEIINQKGLLDLKPSNPAYDGEDDLSSLINRIFIKIDDIKKDTGKYEVVFIDSEITDNSGIDPHTMISAVDLVDLAHIWLEKGEDSYREAVKDRKIVLEQPVEAEEDVMIEVVNMSLDDLWQRDDGLLVEIIGSEGYFRSFGSTWQVIADEGVIFLGDTKIKNILQISENKWSCDELWYVGGSEGYEAYWSDWAEITMSDDGQSLLLGAKATNPVSGEKTEDLKTYYRYSEEQQIQDSQDTDTQDSNDKDTQDTDKEEPQISDEEESSQDNNETEQDISSPEQTVELGLDGYWKSENDCVVKIEGTVSIYIQFSPWQQDFADLGMVSLGDLQMKEIEKTGENQWSCFVMYFYTLDDKPHSAGWSNKSTLTLSEDGKSLTLESSGKHPETGTVFTNTSKYTRTISPADQ
ncbi:MAG: hypothetical protein PHU65_08375, partial [Actinomycetota bacterium]|nr:hypothetical protein [Actinomycetota bacterium]